VTVHLYSLLILSLSYRSSWNEVFICYYAADSESEGVKFVMFG